MDLKKAVATLTLNPDAEIFAISINENKVEFIELIVDKTQNGNHISVSWDYAKIFDENYDNEADSELKDLSDCENDLTKKVFIDKEDVGYFVVTGGAEGHFILSYIFPDLPDAFEIDTDEEKAEFLELATQKILELNREHA